MAELNEFTRQVVLGELLAAYNLLHNTAYGNELEIREHQPWDYCWHSRMKGVPPLFVQLTLAGGDDETERRGPSIARRWNKDEIQQPLLAARPRGCKITMHVRTLPENSVDRKTMGAALRDLVTNALAEPLTVGESRVLGPYDSRGGLAWLEVEGTPIEYDGITIYGPPVHFHEGVGWRAAVAVDRKLSRIDRNPSDIVLAILFDLFPYHDTDIGRMSADLQEQSIPYREVWAISPYSPGARADRIWSRPG